MIRNVRKILLYALAIATPGGFLAIGGYHAYKFMKNKNQKQKVEKDGEQSKFQESPKHDGLSNCDNGKNAGS